MAFNYFFLLSLLGSLLSFASFADDAASVLFDRNSPLVYQIKVIDKASGNKSTLGSGFQVDPSGVIATNYHVVSGFVLEPDKYTIEVLDFQDQSIASELINFDIVHDLALLQVEGLPERSLELNQNPLSQGKRIYSMGNPNDLGMTIIEGTYNGLVEASRYQKYLFSGSLNSGMSGGPVFNTDGEVIGVNVSKGGEQLSFLVPVRYLINLISSGFQPLAANEYIDRATNTLQQDQMLYYRELNERPWITRTFQRFELPDKIHSSLKCWGHSVDSDGELVDETHRHCRSKDQIYIDSDFYTGSFDFSYESITNNKLDRTRFNTLLEENYSIGSFSNNNDEQDTSRFICHTDFIHPGDNEQQHHALAWKVTSCIRKYIKYKGLYDAALIALYADTDSRPFNALKVTLNTTGIDQLQLKQLHDKFLRSVKWKQ